MNETTPPPELEAKIVRALEREGLIRRPRRAVFIASAAGLFAAGLALGLLARAGGGRAAPPEGPRYLLLLESAETEIPGDESARVQAIIAWAQTERAAGRSLAGAKLSDGGYTVTATGSRPLAHQALGGYFVVNAADDAEALRVASSHPLLQWGGTILVRRLE
jgi:hypothetical protein